MPQANGLYVLSEISKCSPRFWVTSLKLRSADIT